MFVICGGHVTQPIWSFLFSIQLQSTVWTQLLIKTDWCCFYLTVGCELTLDPDTVNGNLKLSDNNRKVELVRQYQPYPDHPDRFEFWQLLCKNGLTGRCYWEVEGEGVVQIAVTYRGISRTGYKDACGFGRNHLSWCLICFKEGFSVLHNQSRAYYRLPAPSISSSSSFSNRVAVYVDHPAGTLSFYRISFGRLIHLHTFNTTFTEPLYAGFGFGSGALAGASVSLCSLWKRDSLSAEKQTLLPERQLD